MIARFMLDNGAPIDITVDDSNRKSIDNLVNRIRESKPFCLEVKDQCVISGAHVVGVAWIADSYEEAVREVLE